MKSIETFDDDDFGIAIKCTLTFTGEFDPAGATCELEVAHQPSRAMTFDGAALAEYVTEANDFGPGFHRAQVRVSKAGVSVASEPFIIPVGP